ncbi:hypothetical protein SAMN05216389_10226 [Oceanobacillus limi]|uniref:Hook-length control protein FliK n=1 Tax=Oceanobacillus limi TaxID=930131 RepID=A0A1H9YZW5_9BACI|nr:hypothetical protein [Oceanobacillus limi]SES74705.1 hypothetical protein SAMN05216389_10226 [Oceanobacillus limi]
MNIQQLLGNKIAKTTTDSTNNLRTGQIVQGKINKLFPNNKAQIQLGSQQFIARLEASLTIGANYHFQVNASDSLIHLKVIGDQLKNKERTDTLTLLQQLGLKGTKTNIALLQALLKEKIPFERGQLIKANQLLEGLKGDGAAKEVLKEMIRSRLPMTESVFLALHVRRNSSFSQQINSLVQHLTYDNNSNSNLQQNLLQRLSQLTEQPMDLKTGLVKQIVSEVTTNNQMLFHTLKLAGIIDSSLDYSNWRDNWEVYRTKQPESTITGSTKIAPDQLPYTLQEKTIIKGIENILNNQQLLRSSANEVLKKWEGPINQSITQNNPLSTTDLENLRNEVSQKVAPYLGRDQGMLLKSTSDSLPQLLTGLQILKNENTYRNLEQLFNKTLHSKDQILTQLKQVIGSIGLSYEHNVSGEVTEKQLNTIKSLLIQMVQQSEGNTQESSKQLLHFINGLQLQSVNETASTIQANMMIPAEKLGLVNDMELEFEGKKTEKGDIDSDYCRILFYLELANLKDTVIDMNIQKRTVAITIMNDKLGLDNGNTPLKSVLQKGLEELNYQLSTISFKPIQKKELENKKTPSYAQTNTSYQGVDYRI